MDLAMHTIQSRIFTTLWFTAMLVLGTGSCLALGMGEENEPKPAGASTTTTAPDFSVLAGDWIRPDGGYIITIKSIASDGTIDASYANPNLLPFAQAHASQVGGVLKLFFELRAGGYNGSTYTLEYDAANKILKGVYFQAVQGQKYDIFFMKN